MCDLSSINHKVMRLIKEGKAHKNHSETPNTTRTITLIDDNKND